MDFIRNLASGDNDKVNTPYFIGVFVVIALATPLMLLGIAVVIHHIFLQDNKLDGPTTQLILGMLGAVTGALASALLSKGSWSQMTTKITSMGGAGFRPSTKVDNPEGEV